MRQDLTILLMLTAEARGNGSMKLTRPNFEDVSCFKTEHRGFIIEAFFSVVPVII